MDSSETPEPGITYLFFSSVFVDSKNWLCDFYRLHDANGAVTFRVVLQTIGSRDVIADIAFSEAAGWQILGSTAPIDAGLQWNLITILIERKLHLKDC